MQGADPCSLEYHDIYRRKLTFIQTSLANYFLGAVHPLLPRSEGKGEPAPLLSGQHFSWLLADKVLPPPLSMGAVYSLILPKDRWLSFLSGIGLSGAVAEPGEGWDEGTGEVVVSHPTVSVLECETFGPRG